MHWEDLRRRKPPEGLKAEEWWAALQLARASIFKPVDGLRDVHAQPFRFAMVDPIPEQLHRLDLQAGGKIETPEPLLPEMRDRYIVSSLMEEAITSSLLEGAHTTRVAAKEMLRSQREPQSRGEQMVLNNFIAMQRIRELRGEVLTLDLLLEVHRMLTEDTLDKEDGAGRLRRADESVVVADLYNQIYHVPPSAEQLEERLERLFDFANREEGPFIHPVLRAIILHFWLAYEHPFVDGNGRTARALFYWAMLRSNYWLFEFVPISPPIYRTPKTYYRAFLYTETDHNDLTYFVLYHLAVIDRALRDLYAYLNRKVEEVHRAERELRALEGFNHRQKALLSHALRHPTARYTVESHRHSHQVAYETARSDLLELVQKRLLRKEKEGKRLVFRPAGRLRAKAAKR